MPGVTYVQEVEVGAVFTCEMVGKICTAHKEQEVSKFVE
jgi:hypothetical protein